MTHQKKNNVLASKAPPDFDAAQGLCSEKMKKDNGYNLFIANDFQSLYVGFNKMNGMRAMKYVDQELTIDEMLADPIVQTLMRYDGISASDVRHTIDQVLQNRLPQRPVRLRGSGVPAHDWHLTGLRPDAA